MRTKQTHTWWPSKLWGGQLPDHVYVADSLEEQQGGNAMVDALVEDEHQVMQDKEKEVCRPRGRKRTSKDGNLIKPH